MDFWMVLAIVYEILAIYLVAKFVATLFISLVAILYVHWLANLLFQPTDLVSRYGKWAVVTGCTEGIGKHYAKELAARKMNVVLISRNPEKLKAVAQEIENESGVSTVVVVADFTSGQDVYKKIENEIKDLDIGVLVNNVGVANPQPIQMEMMSSNELWNLVLVNVGAATAMAHLVLPDMKRRGRGAIINISSFFEHNPTPYFSLYGATKAYIKSFSDALRFECRGTGVEVQTLSPTFVNTQLTAWKVANQEPGIFVPSPEIFAKHAVTTLGVTQKTSGYWPHELQYELFKMGSDWMWTTSFLRSAKPFIANKDEMTALPEVEAQLQLEKKAEIAEAGAEEIEIDGNKQHAD